MTASAPLAASTVEAYHVPLAAGTALAAAALALVLPRARRSIADPEVLGAAAVALVWATDPPTSLVLALAALVGVGVWASRAQPTAVAGAVAAVAVAVAAVAAPEVPGVGWEPAAVVAAVVVAGALAASTAAVGRRLVLALLVVALGGAWATLPDTEGVLVAGVVAGVALLSTWLPGAGDAEAGAGRPGARAAAVLCWLPFCVTVAWAVVWGGRGRASSIIGAAGALGVLLVLPLVRAVPGLAARRTTGAAVLLLAVQVVAAAVAARVASLDPDVGRAVAIVAVDLVLTAVAVGAVLGAGTARRT